MIVTFFSDIIWDKAKINQTKLQLNLYKIVRPILITYSYEKLLNSLTESLMIYHIRFIL